MVGACSVCGPRRQLVGHRRGRTCVFFLHVHLVFVTKRRRGALDARPIERLAAIFTAVCPDYSARLVQMDAEAGHVHLLVNYPPKVAVSRLVASLKGVFSRRLRQERPDLARFAALRLSLWSPSYFAGACGGAPLAVVKQYIERHQTPT